MRRAALSAAVGLAAFSAAASAQLVPLARCQTAFPCSIPYGLRPADAVSNLPDARLGNSLVGIETGLDGFKPRLAVSPVSEDPSESAARLFVKHNPLKVRTPTPAPTPAPAAKAAPPAKP
jgi:hypothetical protein